MDYKWHHYFCKILKKEAFLFNHCVFVNKYFKISNQNIYYKSNNVPLTKQKKQFQSTNIKNIAFQSTPYKPYEKWISVKFPEVPRKWFSCYFEQKS